MRLLLLFTIAIMTIPVFADGVKTAEKLPDTTKQVDKEVKGEPDNKPETEQNKQINVIESPGTNVVLVDRLKDDYLVVDITSKVHNWWMIKLTGVKGKTVTVGFNMDEKGDVSKWSGLQPVYSYADPDKIESFEWFTKDNGKWKSGNAFLPEDKRDAGDGKSPEQSVIPNEIADEFLSKDGYYWEPWGRITKTEVKNNLNIFRFTQTFTQDSVWVAMRYPFSYRLLQNYIEVIKTKKDTRIRTKVIGTTLEKRDLFAIEIKSSRFFIKQPGTIFIYSREHATEPDGSHAVIGIINAILSDKMDKWPRLSIIPIFDPDSVVANRYEGMINSFNQLQLTTESTAIIKYAQTLKDNNQYIDTSISLHNVECNEANNLWMPHADFMKWWAIEKIKKQIDEKAKRSGYTITPEVREMTFQGNRFEGWVADNLHTVAIIYELNSQSRNSLLTLKSLQEIGPLIVSGIDESLLHDEWIGEFRQY